MSELDRLKQRLYDIDALDTAVSVMDWDQQTYMPEGSNDARSEHVGILSRMSHELFTADETGRLLESARAEAESEVDQALIRVTQREFDLATKIPTALVEEKSRLASQAHEIWVKARQENDFAAFAPSLARMFEIARQEAEHLGYQAHIYDALLDQYEEGATTADAQAMFAELKGPQVALVKAIVDSGGTPDDSKLHGDWDVAKQRAFTEEIVRAIGFDFEHGRQDTAPHPFCTNFSVTDVRLTTRFQPYLGSAIFSSLHEAGHGMYEQGSPHDWDRLPLSGGVSLGVHESQSRTWENIVGRSLPFWEQFLPRLQSYFPELSEFDAPSFVRAINKVEPSLIRVEADECTYNLHVLVRFELECDLLTGALQVNDLPEAWNAKYEAYLGIRPPNDSDGVLQDVHWSAGLIGYFPTYTMGNLLSYQIWNTLERDLGDTDAMLREGNFRPILTWLQEKIYSKGSMIPPKELILAVTGKPMGTTDYLTRIEQKYRALYELA